MAKTKKKQIINRGKLSGTTRKSIRPSRRKDMPSSVFLLPGEKKYPVKKKNKNTGKWEYDPNLLLAAQRRARLQNNSSVEIKARALLKKITGK